VVRVVGEELVAMFVVALEFVTLVVVRAVVELVNKVGPDRII
jgi:hypothetical protein